MFIIHLTYSLTVKLDLYCDVHPIELKSNIKYSFIKKKKKIKEKNIGYHRLQSSHRDEASFFETNFIIFYENL